MDNIIVAEIDTEHNTSFDSDMIPSNLLGLPHLVMNEILDYFPLVTLKKLRLVSKQMKKFVETPRHLEKFRIIATTKIQKEMFNSLSNTVHWNNFYFPWSWSMEPFANELSENIFKNYGHYISHLHIDERMDYKEIKMVVNSLCPLDSECSSSNIKTFLFCLDEPFNPDFDNYDDIKNWNKILKNVKSLGIKYYLNLDPVITFLYKFLINVPNLNNLEIRLGNYRNSGQSGLVILFSLLKRYSEFIKCSHKKNNLIIDFNMHARLENNSKNFFDLLKVSNEIGVKFSNVPCEFIHEYNIDITNNMKNIYDKSIISVKSNQFNQLKNIYVPSTSKIRVDINNSFNFNALQWNESICILPIDPIYKIEVEIYCVHTSVEILILHLFNFIRPTVKELSIRFNCFCRHEDHHHGVYEVPPTLFYYYPNLEKLELYSNYYNINRPNFYNNLFFNCLENLNYLDIYCFCTDGLNDGGLIGQDINNPTILQLPNLTHMEINNVKLTNSSFVNVFRFMRLKTFRFSNCIHMDDYDGSVTFQNGISTLATIEGGFKNTIEFFEIILPIDSTMLEMDEFINENFKNLCKKTINEKKDIACFSLEDVDYTQ